MSMRLLPPASTRALLAIDGPAAATFNTIIEAADDYEGPAGNAITLTTTATGGTWVPNVGTLTLAGNAVENETVTIGDTVYRWRDTLAQAYDVKIGASAALSIVNLVAAINANGTAGTHYFAGTLVHPTVRAYDGAGDTVVVHTNSNTILTAVGTLIATTETMTNGSWAAATLADGTDGVNVSFSVVGTAVTAIFATTYSTVSDFEAALAADEEASALIRVKTAGTTPLYVLATGTDAFSATKLTGGGSTTVAAPTLTDASLGVKFNALVDQALILVRNVDLVATQTKTMSPILWGFVYSTPTTGVWYQIGALNRGTAIAETSADAVNYAEVVSGLRGFGRLYCQLTVAGTGTEGEVVAIPFQAGAVT